LEVDLFFKAALIFFLLIFSGLFSGSETALFSLTLLQRERLRKSGNKRAALIDKLLLRPRRLIVTILMGNDLVNIAASVIATYFFVSLLGEHGKWLTIAIMTPLTLILAEVIPKTIGVTHNEKIAPLISAPLNTFAKLISPLRWIFIKLTDCFMKLSGMEKYKPSPTIMEDDFRDMVDLSYKNGELKIVERDLIHNVFEFSDTHVSEVMIPKENMFCLHHDMDAESIVKFVKKNHYSRIPVFKENINNIIGILYVKDLLKVVTKKYKGKAELLPGICRRPYFIQENKKIDEVFYSMKQQRTHIAICLTEQGKVSGLITLEDLLEELFGEIYDEHDPVDVS
jgi:putative hemolysin